MGERKLLHSTTKYQSEFVQMGRKTKYRSKVSSKCLATSGLLSYSTTMEGQINPSQAQEKP
jgi:hypothetical protein